MTPMRTHVALCYGTRPQTIKASVLARALGPHYRLTRIDTGQHYDYELNALLYEQLGVTKPDLLLDVGSSDHAVQTAAVLTRAAAAFTSDRPAAALVIGDTNSTLGAALAAAKLRIPVVHVEAGLRAADALMAEEINRRAVDAIASVLCTPSAAATARVRQERADALVRETGDVAFDVLRSQLDRLSPAHRAAGWPLGEGTPFVFATLHRAELTDVPERLASVLRALASLPHPVVLATHPRTRVVIERHGIDRSLGGALGRSLFLLPPLGYHEALACTREARAVVTDSGGIQREAYWLGTPCITMRGETEWHETLALGANRLLAPADAERLPALFAEADGGRRDWARDAYGDGTAAERVTAAVRELLAGVAA
jgi:UDP-GlcNAc3NAcA epimerase